jgi:hypothetical protein
MQPQSDRRRRLTRTAAIAAASIALFAATPATAGPGVVAEIDTSTWDPPSPDPSGIAFIARSDRFMVVDGEVDETPHWDGVNAWLIDRDGSALRSMDLTAYTTEPTDVSVFRKTIYISDDVHDTILRMRRGRDGRLGTNDDLVRSISTHRFGSTDPEGLFKSRRFLFIADGAESRNPAIYRINPGRDGRFGGDDDRVLRIDAGRLGLQDPEGVTYARRSLFIVSRLGRNRGIVRANLRGELLETYDLAGTGLRRSAGIAVVRAGDGFLEAWVTDRGSDNDADRNENDGKIFVFSLETAA